MMTLANLAGHYWTLLPDLQQRLKPLRAPTSRDWSTELAIEDRSIMLTGRWREEAGAGTALVVVHGLGGGAQRPYCVRAARAAAERRWSCLRLALRGADGRGEDFYHAGLYADLAAAVGCEELRRYEKIVLLGYSLGGHLILRYLCASPDPRVRAGAAVCSPLDLARAASFLDEGVPTFYLRHILSRLLAIYAEVARRHPVPTPVERLRTVGSIREWDRLTVVPRHGFASADDYYQSESASGHLAKLSRPALLVAGRHDPLLPARDVEAVFPGPAEKIPLSLRWAERGGHVGFPSDLSLGMPGALGLEAQVLRWLEEPLRGDQ